MLQAAGGNHLSSRPASTLPSTHRADLVGTQPFLPEGPGPAVTLPEQGCCFLLTLITGHGSTERRCRGPPASSSFPPPLGQDTPSLPRAPPCPCGSLCLLVEPLLTPTEPRNEPEVGACLWVTTGDKEWGPRGQTRPPHTGSETKARHLREASLRPLVLRETSGMPRSPEKRTLSTPCPLWRALSTLSTGNEKTVLRTWVTPHPRRVKAARGSSWFCDSTCV